MGRLICIIAELLLGGGMYSRAVYISVAAVTAAWGSALTAAHFWKSAKSKQKRFAPPLGTSPGLGVPSLRHCSVGRREGPSMAQRG
jgi:hypothetical protein